MTSAWRVSGGAAITPVEPPILAINATVCVTEHDDGDVVVRIADGLFGGWLLIPSENLRDVTMRLARILLDRGGEAQ